MHFLTFDMFTCKLLYTLYVDTLVKRTCWTHDWLLNMDREHVGLFNVIKELAAGDPELFYNILRLYNIYKIILFKNWQSY